jgi:hypothetical protein
VAVRDAIYNQIMEKGWSPQRRAFVQHYDTDVLDASLLLMPICKFIAPIDPRWISTLDAISAELVSDSLVHRYNVDPSPDGLSGEEGTFSLCSFWWVEALARAGRLDEARLAFEKMLTYANHVGLYSEEIGPTGEQLGNFPQAFTHLALISAAYNLDRQLGERRPSRRRHPKRSSYSARPAIWLAASCSRPSTISATRASCRSATRSSARVGAASTTRTFASGPAAGSRSDPTPAR